MALGNIGEHVEGPVHVGGYDQNEILARIAEAQGHNVVYKIGSTGVSFEVEQSMNDVAQGEL